MAHPQPDGRHWGSAQPPAHTPPPLPLWAFQCVGDHAVLGAVATGLCGTLACCFHLGDRGGAVPSLFPVRQARVLTGAGEASWVKARKSGPTCLR